MVLHIDPNQGRAAIFAVPVWSHLPQGIADPAVKDNSPTVNDTDLTSCPDSFFG